MASKRSSKAAMASKRSSKKSDTADEVRGHLRGWAEEVKLTPNDDTVSLETVADSGGIPVKRVQQWIGEGKLPPCRGVEGMQYWSALDGPAHQSWTPMTILSDPLGRLERFGADVAE